MVTSGRRGQDSEESQGYSSLSFSSLTYKKTEMGFWSPLTYLCPVSICRTLSGPQKGYESYSLAVEQLFTSCPEQSSAHIRSEGTEERNKRKKLRDLSLSSTANVTSPVSNFLVPRLTILRKSSLADARPLSSFTSQGLFVGDQHFKKQAPL